MTEKPVVIVGIGEMGGVFARGFLQIGHPVYPVTRQTSADLLAQELSGPELVLLAVAEADSPSMMDGMPEAWREHLVLQQNELLPKDWQSRGLEPTVISVWFEKKKGQDAKVLIPSPVYGPKAQLVAEGLGAVDIPTRVLNGPDELLFELVRKNLYNSYHQHCRASHRRYGGGAARRACGSHERGGRGRAGYPGSYHRQRTR